MTKRRNSGRTADFW